ncbi:hypothetical protein [Methylobacterium sp. WL116]|uniref:hypothetical protein n=1 Tax=Methylobacterium sp. WL116 TaxID=2603889 RepID=UPI0011CA653F|nr:hypothetical protein [Methylobacterium sp. WL116]TXM95082.1 hypothetical protein FV223_02105 [Methylobacterium sp. WL116]
MTQLIDLCVRVKEYENGNPYILLEQQGTPGTGAADAMKPFAFDLRPGIPMAEVEALVAEMRRVITHVHFEEAPIPA